MTAGSFSQKDVNLQFQSSVLFSVCYMTADICLHCIVSGRALIPTFIDLPALISIDSTFIIFTWEFTWTLRPPPSLCLTICFSLKNRHHPCVHMSSCPPFLTASHGHVGPFWWRSNLTSVCGFGLVREKQSRGSLKLQTQPVFDMLINPSWWKTTASEKKVMSLTLGILPSPLSLSAFCQTLCRLFLLLMQI